MRDAIDRAPKLPCDRIPPVGRHFEGFRLQHIVLKFAQARQPNRAGGEETWWGGAGVATKQCQHNATPQTAGGERKQPGSGVWPWQAHRRTFCRMAFCVASSIALRTHAYSAVNRGRAGSGGIAPYGPLCQTKARKGLQGSVQSPEAVFSDVYVCPVATGRVPALVAASCTAGGAVPSGHASASGAGGGTAAPPLGASPAFAFAVALGCLLSWSEGFRGAHTTSPEKKRGAVNGGRDECQAAQPFVEAAGVDARNSPTPQYARFSPSVILLAR